MSKLPTTTRVISTLILTAMVSACLPSKAALAYPADTKFVRTAVPFMRLVQPSDYDTLAKYDVITLPAELQVSQPFVFGELRKRNPNIILIAYIPTKSYITGWGDSLHLALQSGIDQNWWLRDSSGSPISVWPGTRALSITTDWNTYLPHFVHEKVLSTGNWDGIFFDEVSDSISWANGGNVDLNRDSSPDNASTADAAWKAGMKTLLATARNLDPNKIFVINGVSTPDYQPLINGRMFETFPTPWEANGDWYEIMRRYLANESIVAKPETFIINANTANTGTQADYKKMRFGLASTLLGNGFYSFDYGDQNHGQTWWYDEYNTVLGKPVGAAKNTTVPTSTKLQAGVWQRDYQNGIVLVNPTNSAKTVTFTSEYEKLHGTQDPTTNNGSIVSSVTVQPQDGLLMLRPLDKVTNAPYLNGSFIRILDAKGKAQRTGFFAYDSRFRGSSIVLTMDLNNDGQAETVVADKTNVTIYNANGSVRVAFAPYGTAWKNGMEIAAGDFNGDKIKEIAVAPNAGGQPLVKIYDQFGKEQKNFLAYSKNFTGGVHLAAGNTDTQAGDEIVTGAGAGGGPHVRVWSGSGILKKQFFAYAQNFTGGVFVAVGDTLGIGHAQVITGSGFGGGPQVRIFDTENGNRAEASFFAYDTKTRSGVRVTSQDVNGDGRAEILAETTDVFTVASVGAPANLPTTETVTPTPNILTPADIIDQNKNTDAETKPETVPDHPLFLGMKP